MTETKITVDEAIRRGIITPVERIEVGLYEQRMRCIEAESELCLQTMRLQTAVYELHRRATALVISPENADIRTSVHSALKRFRNTMLDEQIAHGKQRDEQHRYVHLAAKLIGVCERCGNDDQVNAGLCIGCRSQEEGII